MTISDWFRVELDSIIYKVHFVSPQVILLFMWTHFRDPVGSCCHLNNFDPRNYSLLKVLCSQYFQIFSQIIAHVKANLYAMLGSTQFFNSRICKFFKNLYTNLLNIASFFIRTLLNSCLFFLLFFNKNKELSSKISYWMQHRQRKW